MKSIEKSGILPIIGVLGVLFLIFVFVLFPLHWKSVQTNLEILDLRWIYSPEDVNVFFNALGIEGIKTYNLFLLFDTFYAFTYGALLILLLVFLQQHMGKLGVLIKWTRWLPLVAVLLDITENINIFFMLYIFPEISIWLVKFGSTITLIKWYAVSVCVVLLLCSLLAVFLRNVLWMLRGRK
jgi:hypothetical protein